jgi:SSS family solute:Na+ symporter
MLSTSLSKDIYKRYLAPEASDAQVLKVARLAALAGGGLAILLVFVIPTVIDSLTIFYSVMSVSLFVPIVVGLHSRRAGVPEALAAIGVGVTVLIIVELSKRSGFPPWMASRWLDRTLLGILASGAAFAIVQFIRRPTSQGAP